MPRNALTELTPNLRKELGEKARGGAFDVVLNRKRLWTKGIEICGSELQLYTVQTES